MWPFDKTRKNVGSASGLTSLEHQVSAVKIAELEMRIHGLEMALNEICYLMGQHLERIDQNTIALNKNMHNLAAATLRPPKDLLNGGSEPN